MILDKSGKPIRKVEATAKAVVFKSSDGESWEPVHGYSVPKCVTDPEAMGWMLEGQIIETNESTFYRAELMQ